MKIQQKELYKNARKVYKRKRGKASSIEVERDF